MHLWEVDHSYYMTTGNYFDRECHISYPTLDAFLAAERDADLDYNYVVRWDWLEGEDWGAGEYKGDDYYRNGILKIQWVGQRKAILRSAEISVCRADEPEVRKFLEPRFKYVMELWEPFAA